VTLRHFDVVVLGRSLGCLSAAALLARRDFRVLVLGHGSLPASYAWQNRRIARRPFSLLFGETPVWRRILQDLAQSQTFRRRTHRPEPSFSVLARGVRLQVSADRGQFASEVRRVFPELELGIDEVGLAVAHAHRALEAALERDSEWPPEGFFARLRARRWLGNLPWLGESLHVLLDKLPGGHAYREAAFLAARFASDLGQPTGELPLLATARLQQHCVRQTRAFEAGEAGFEDFLVQRIRAHGGSCELAERVDGLRFRGGRISGVVIGGGEQTIGTDHVLTDLEGRALVELAGGGGAASESARRPELTPALGRFVVNCWVRAAGLPEPLGADALLLPSVDARGRERPAMHLQHDTLDPTTPDAPRLLIVEVLIPLASAYRGRDVRTVVLDALRDHFPFFDRHLLLCDSPHDGQPLHLYEAGRRREIDRVHLSGGSPRAEPLQALWRCEAPGFLGLAGEPMVGPIRGSWLVGKTVFPGLGQEGELLAAWAAAQRVTRSDRAWQKRRRQMWSKIDTDSS
jgi:hypothetical protein